MDPHLSRIGVAVVFESRSDLGIRTDAGIRFATEDELDVIVEVIVDAVIGQLARQLGGPRLTGQRRREADQEQRRDNSEQGDERGQQYRLRHRCRERLAHESR